MGRLLILPMAFYVFYIWFIAMLTFRTRKAAIKNGELDPKFFKTYAGQIPERVSLVGRHLDNQFQVPLLFLITCNTEIVMGNTDGLTLALAWGFVATRIAHSHIHLGRNQIIKRAVSFALGFILILGMWLQLAYFALT